MRLFSTPQSWIAIITPILILSLTTTLVFNIKKDNTKNTTPIFNIMLHTSLINLTLLDICMILITYTKIPLFISQILIRIFLVSNNLYITFVSIYLATVIHLDTVRNKNLYDSTVRRHIMLFTIVSIIQVFLPVNLHNCEMSGAGSIFSSLYFIIQVPYWCYLLYKYRKEANFTWSIQATLFTLGGVLAIVFGIAIPESHTVPVLEYMIIFILYLRNENPDLKYISELNESKMETEKALEAKNDFLNSMSEELREPLNNIIHSANAMQDYIDQVNEEVKEDLELILPTSRNLYEIVGNIIDINKIDNNEIKIYQAPYNPIEMIKEIIEEEKTKVNNENVEIKLQYDNNMPTELTGDERHVKQIVHNLVNNAMKYTENGEITIKVLTEKISFDTINLKVKVTDTGIGIKNETLITLFTNFSKSTEQKNSNVSGTGLGLAITKKLIDLLNGTITVESIYGSGSTFTVTIPHKIQ